MAYNGQCTRTKLLFSSRMNLYQIWKLIDLYNSHSFTNTYLNINNLQKKTFLIATGEICKSVVF